VAPPQATRLACRLARRRHQPGPPGSVRGALGRGETGGELPPGSGRRTNRPPGPHQPPPATGADRVGVPCRGPRVRPPPIHITQLQTRDLDRPQAQPRDQHHDREVANANQAAAVATVEQPLDLRGRHSGRRQRGQTPPTNWRHGRPQRQRCNALHIQEPQDRAQLSHPPLDRSSRDATALPQQERVNVHPAQRSGLEHLIDRRLFLQEAASGVLVAPHRGRGQTTLLDQPGPVLPEQ
jgi:hypothetical protein